MIVMSANVNKLNLIDSSLPIKDILLSPRGQKLYEELESTGFFDELGANAFNMLIDVNCLNSNDLIYSYDCDKRSTPPSPYQCNNQLNGADPIAYPPADLCSTQQKQLLDHVLSCSTQVEIFAPLLLVPLSSTPPVEDMTPVLSMLDLTPTQDCN
jgi:hypothetical protein